MSTFGYLFRYAFARLLFEWLRDSARARRRRAERGPPREAPAPRPRRKWAGTVAPPARPPPRPPPRDLDLALELPAEVGACGAVSCVWNTAGRCTRTRITVVPSNTGGPPRCGDYAPRVAPTPGGALSPPAA